VMWNALTKLCLVNFMQSSCWLLFVGVLSILSLQVIECQEWDYDPCSEGPNTWAANYPMCGAGTQQSPIDITTFEVYEDPTLTPLVFNWNQGLGKVFFNGETCQTNIENQAMSITEGPLGNDTYYMVQFHTHEVSEHHIDGVAYPLELHFVHKNSRGAIAVVGFFFRVSPTNSTFIGEFINFCTSSGVSDNLDFSTLLNFPTVGHIPYYTYPGSLTTPPCTEGVTWILIPQIFTVSRAQLNQFMSMLPHHNANNRPIQNLNARVIRYFSGITPGFYVTELGILYESCKKDNPIAPSEKRNNWQNLTLLLDGVQPGQTIYAVFQVFDIPVIPMIDIEYVRVEFDNLWDATIVVEMRQVHKTTQVQTKSTFFSMSKAQRQQYYQSWLPDEIPHNTDINYLPPQTIANCGGDFTCGYVVDNPIIDLTQTDVLPIFVVSIRNNGTSPLGDIKMTAFAGDKTPSCRIPPTGIVLGSIWTAVIVLIIGITTGILAWENYLLNQEKKA
jgi:carbonic anhydrase